MTTAEMLPAGVDPNTFVMNGDGTVSYRNMGTASVRIPLNYFTGGMYQKDMQQYGQVMGPSGIFQAGSTYQPGSAGAFTGDATGGADQSLYMQNDQGQVIGYTAPEQARRDAIDKAYQALASGSGGATSFDVPGQPPKQLGSDVFTALANGGLWMPAGSDVSGRNKNIEARIGQNGEIVVVDPRGGDGQNPVYIYDQSGNYLRSEVGSKAMSPAMGVAMVGLSALGMGALGAASGAGGLGAGAAGAGTGAAAGAEAGAAGVGAAGAGAGAGAGALGTGGLTAAEMEAAALTGGSTLTGDAALAAYAGLPTVSAEAMASALGMTPEAFASLGAGGIGAAGAAAGMTQGTAAATSGLLPSITNPLTGQPFDWTSLLGPAATLAGGLVSSNAATDAADAQLQAQREAQALQEPWRQAGINGLNRLQELLGVGGDAGATDYGSAAKDFSQPAPQWQNYTGADLQSDPGYQFRMDEGENALQRAYAGKGSFLSGAAMKGIDKYGQDYASNEFQNGFNRANTSYQNEVSDYNGAYSRYQTDRAAKLSPLQSLAGLGQSSATTMGGNVSNAGDAAAAGTIGSSNALANSLTNAFSSYQSTQNANSSNALMKALLASRGITL